MCKTNNCVIVDNTPDREIFSLYENSNIIYIPLKVNLGIAKAQNIAIEEVKKRKGQYILFLDQDSTICYEFAEQLLMEYTKISSSGIKISALGPSLKNTYSGKPYKTENVKIYDGYTIPSVLISSGMLVEINTINEVGNMDETLFIDYVDFEWCWRAKTKGYVCCMSRKIEMKHKVGVRDKNILGYAVLISVPIRYYYKYRNYLKLCYKKYVPLKWKIKTGLKNICFLLYIPLVSNNKIEIWQNMFKGIKDGLK